MSLGIDVLRPLYEDSDELEDKYLRFVDKYVNNKNQIFQNVEQKYFGQRIIDTSIKNFEEIKEELEYEIQTFDMYQEHQGQEQRYENYYEYSYCPQSLQFNIMTQEDDRQIYAKQQNIEIQNSIQSYDSKQLFLKEMCKKVIKNKTKENIRSEVRKRNQKAQEFMSKFQAKKQKYIKPDHVPHIQQQNRIYGIEYLQQLEKQQNKQYERLKQQYDPSYQPFLHEVEIIQKQVQEDKANKNIERALKFINLYYKQMHHKPLVIKEAEENISQIEETKYQLIQKMQMITYSLQKSQKILQIKKQAITQLDKEMQRNEQKINDMKQQLEELTKLQHTQKGEQQQQLNQKSSIQSRIQSELGDLKRQLQKKEVQNKTIQLYINETLTKDEQQILKRQQDTKQQIATLQKKCSVQENNLIAIEEAKAKVIQKICKRQNEYNAYQEKADKILDDFKDQSSKIYNQIQQQQDRVSYMFNNIKEKYKEICDTQKEIDKINNK